MTMKRELDAERTAAERVFKKREKQIEAQLRNLAGLYGSTSGGRPTSLSSPGS